MPVDQDLRIEFWVGNPDSYFQSKGVNLLQQTIITLAIFLKSSIVITNIYELFHYMLDTFTFISLNPSKNPMIGIFLLLFKDIEPKVQKG